MATEERRDREALSASRARLGVVPRERWAEHLPALVIASIGDRSVDAFPVDDAASDTDRFAARYGVALDDCANTLVLRFRRGGVDLHAAVVALGSRRLDVNGAVKAALGAQRLTFAKQDAAVEATRMESGGITAFGLPPDWTVLVDAAVLARPYVVMGAGWRRSKLLLEPAVLLTLATTVAATLS